METMVNVWAVVEHVRVASGAAELAIFTAILYWFFTSSRVADMLEVVGERVGGWCGRDSNSLRQAVRARRRHNDIYTKLDADRTNRANSLYRVKEGPIVPAPQPTTRPPAGLACPRCAPISRESWQDPQSPDTGAVINILDIGQQTFANGGVVSRYLCDLAQCCNLLKYDYRDVVPEVVKDESFQKAIADAAAADGAPDAAKRVNARAMKILGDISSAMSNRVLKLVAWLCHKAVRRIAGGGCGTRAACVERLRRAKAAGLPLIFVPLHRSHLDYILITFTLYLTGLRPPLVAAGDNMRIPFFGWFLRGCGAFYIKRSVDGSDKSGDPNLYKTALRSYILNSLAAKNNLEFFIEGGRTRTGKPQPPKAGILSVIMDAYLDGTIDDALLVPVTVNYDRLVDGNFVREQLGVPKQMETFWSAARGIWRTLNTNHGSIRVDFNQPLSLKELAMSFKNYHYLKAPIERSLTPPNNLAEDLDRKILYNHSHSSMYGADVSVDHKMMVEAIGRHIVYDAAQATALMCTNVVSYVLLTEHRRGCSFRQLCAGVGARGRALAAAGRDLGYTGDPDALLRHALDMLGRSLVRRAGAGDKQSVRPQRSIAASLELSYYANAVVAHYAAPAVVATALESIIRQPDADQEIVRHTDLMTASLQLCEILSQEFILSAPCVRIQETIMEAVETLASCQVLTAVQTDAALEEQRWSQRVARTFDDDDDDERPDPAAGLKYKLSARPEALAERARLLRTIRPLLEAYAAATKMVRDGTQKELVKATLDSLTEDYTQNRLIYGEAVSTDAIMNCWRLLQSWGVVELYTEQRVRRIRTRTPLPPDHYFHRFNVRSPLLNYYP